MSTTEAVSSSGIAAIGCSSWSEFKTRIITDLFPDGRFRKGVFLFRGQGSDSWELSSTFDRWYSGPKEKRSSTAEELLTEFIKECEGEDLPPHVGSDRTLMRSLGQHNGLPTRLLDWSESPYVAAFFAFSGHLRAGLHPEDKNIAVWVLDTTSHIWNPDYGCEIVSVPSFGNERIRNQHGKFTHLRALYTSLEEYVSHSGDNAALKKYVVPARDAGIAMADLDSMGLSHSHIYPGNSGNAKAAEVRVLLRHHP